MTYLEDEYSPDDWLVPHRPEYQETAEQFQARVKAKYEKTVKSEVAPLDFSAGLKLSSPKWEHVIDDVMSGKGKTVSFTLVLDKKQLRLEAGMPTGTQYAIGKVAVPSDLEDYRTFLINVRNWADGALVSESEFKDWEKKNPKKPTEHKSYAEMAKKSKSDTDAFRDWAKKNKAKVLEAFDKTAKLKDSDAARVKAVKDIDAALKDYYKTF